MNKKLVSILVSSSFILNPIICQNHNLFSQSSYCVKIGKRYSYNNIMPVLEKLNNILSQEPTIINKESKPNQNVYIIGDLHGNYSSLDFIRNKIYKDPDDLFIFLGDYVDRGNNSIEVFIDLAELKIQNPENIILLSGNHERHNEDIQASGSNTLKEDIYWDYNYEDYSINYNILQKYKNELLMDDEATEGDALYCGFTEVFKKLPLAVNLKINNKNILCVHGGVPIKQNDIVYLDNIPTENEEIIPQIVNQLLWNDPKRNCWNGITRCNRGKDFAIKYLWNHVDKFLKANNISHVFRAHELVKNGFSDDYNNKKHFTVFSSANYLEVNPYVDKDMKKSDASIVKINPDGSSMEVIRFGGNLNDFSSGLLSDYEMVSTETVNLN